MLSLVDAILTLIIAACLSAAIFGMVKRSAGKCADCKGCTGQNCAVKKPPTLKFKKIRFIDKAKP